MASAGYDYSALMDAVTKAYGKDVWNGITTASDFYSSDFAQKITQVDGVSATYLKNGNVAYYTYADEVVGIASDASNVINSNTGLSTVNTTLNVPAEVTVDTTGKVVAESGLKKVSTGSKVTATLGKVAVGVAAVGAGVQLGATIDSALYSLNPDFWDANNMSSLNPETWDSICSTQGGKDVFNMVFGIDKGTGETQPYIDQNALAYIAQYLSSQGAFDMGLETPNTYIPQNSNWNLESVEVSSLKLPMSLYVNPIVTYSGFTVTVENNADDVYMGYGYVTPTDLSCQPYYASKSPFNLRRVSPSGSSSVSQAFSIIIDDNTYYAYYYGTAYPPSAYNPLVENHVNYFSIIRNFVKVIFNQDLITTGKIDGITPQQGATVPSGITSDMSISDVLDALRTQYPDLFNNAITNNVVQPDGSVVDNVYLPINIPDNVTITDSGQVQPTGGADSTQANSTITENSTDNLINTLLQIITQPDPYQPTSEETPTDNDYPDTGDGLTPTPIIPTGTAGALYSIYNPSQAEINSLGAWLWSPNFVDQLLKMFNDPMQAIIGLHKVFATPIISGQGDIKVGYLNSGVISNIVGNQYTSLDCGTVNLYEYFENVLDYTQTDVYIYLPFIGIVPLNVSDVMRASINVSYKVDVLTGACLCSVNVTRDLGGGQLYTYSGNCAVQYPLSSGSYMGIISSILGIAGSVAGTLASGGAMLPLALGASASAIGGMRANIEHSGNISGNAGAMGIKTPYIIIRRPQTAIADNFEKYNGIASNKYVNLSTTKGLTIVKYANLENIPQATGEEMTMVEQQLLNGVII